ncbi:hypothetical protein B0O41_0891 [Propionibacteriaceae bacterium ES.041]|nr:hypothetical protein CGZ96_15780 [Enemella evansiae]OYO07718.1 hypothetical protein BI335_20340 [Enemella evansiae]OYO09035.1 hypothetical protein CGZ98_14755 [Enemella evansiae]PFG66112.1 hypothetical protein B0O41_0891 [Propionibacteriaceae bacterium ES.041]TDO85979.1 hypothetical protein C8D81_3860 [Enemella evansiae]
MTYMATESQDGGATDGVLAKECDTGPLGVMVDGVVAAVEVLQTIFNGVMNTVQTAIDWANKITLGVIPWLDDVLAACRKGQEAVNKAYDIYQQALQGLVAPWYIKCIGEKIRDGMGPRTADFAESLDPSQLKSKESWQGAGAEAFFKAADKQQAAAGEAKGGVLTFGGSMVKLGDSGITATYTFLVAMSFAAVGLGLAIGKMAAVPAGTAIGAAEIIGLIAAIVATIKVFVDLVNSLASQAREFTSAVATVPMQGTWPAATV